MTAQCLALFRTASSITGGTIDISSMYKHIFGSKVSAGLATNAAIVILNASFVVSISCGTESKSAAVNPKNPTLLNVAARLNPL